MSYPKHYFCNLRLKTFEREKKVFNLLVELIDVWVAEKRTWLTNPFAIPHNIGHGFT